MTYLQSVVEKYEITDKIQVNTDVKSCSWNEAEGVWDLVLQHMAVGAGDLSAFDRKEKVEKEGDAAVFTRIEKIKAKVVISCVGGLVEPNQWPKDISNEKFEGQIFHSARWKYDVDLKDKNVIVLGKTLPESTLEYLRVRGADDILGTGCSAAQFVPRLRKEYGAKSVTQLMR